MEGTSPHVPAQRETVTVSSKFPVTSLCNRLSMYMENVSELVDKVHTY